MSIRVAVDPTNPGQFFACCGLLELADRLWPGAEGWFERREFCIECKGSLADLTSRLAQAEISSSLSPSQLKRLGTLLSVAKSTLTPADLQEKQQLSEMWKHERLHISAPFDLWLDWWRDERGERTELKTWAAKQFVAEMARDMLRTIKEAEWSKAPRPEQLFQFVRADSLPFNFDSDLSGQGSARDAGFSADALGLKSAFRPLLELTAFIGLQRFRPATAPDDKLRFCLWSTPLLPSVAAAASEVFGSHGGVQYEFRLFSRTQYMKAFLPAQPYRGD
jgi:CRISPR-associated protein Csb3